MMKMSKGGGVKALVATDYGPPSKVLRLADLPTPEPESGQVLVRVEAAALNPIDVKLITGALRERVPLRHPWPVGMDTSGVIAEVGPGVAEYRPDDPVLGLSDVRAGAVAEYTLVEVGPMLSRRPAGLEATIAAAIPEAGLTARDLMRAAEIKPGQRVLVIGATGGVGMFVVQEAARQGARVLATGGPGDRDYLDALGAAETIDYTSQDVIGETRVLVPDGVDVVIDLVHSDRSIIDVGLAARPSGRIVSPLHGPQELGRDVTASYIGQMTARRGELADLAESVRAGLHVELGAVYPFAQAVQAVADFADRHVQGKTVITLD